MNHVVNHIYQTRAYLLTLICAMLVACATPSGGVRPFENYAGDVLATANEVVTLTRTLLAARKISSADAENVLKAAEVAKQGVAVARTVAASEGPVIGNARLRVAADAIEKFQTYLLTKK